jgi:hypothetical protein
MANVSYCFISINNTLLVAKCYSSLVVSGSSRNEVYSWASFNILYTCKITTATGWQPNCS